MQFKRELCWVCARRDLLLRFGMRNLVSQSIHPRFRQRSYAVAHPPRTAIELQGSCRKETAASENGVLHVLQPTGQHRLQSLQTPWFGQRWLDHLLQKNFLRPVHCRDLQFFLRPEVREDPRFAHPQLRRQPPDRQPLQPFGGSQVRRQRKNLLPRSRRFGPPVKNGALLPHRTIVLYRMTVLLSSEKPRTGRPLVDDCGPSATRKFVRRPACSSDSPECPRRWVVPNVRTVYSWAMWLIPSEGSPLSGHR